MIAGKSVAMKFHQPQVVAVRLPELRLPAPRPNRSLGHDTARPAAAGLVPARPAPVRPVPAEPCASQCAGRHGGAVASSRANGVCRTGAENRSDLGPQPGVRAQARRQRTGRGGHHHAAVERQSEAGGHRRIADRRGGQASGERHRSRRAAGRRGATPRPPGPQLGCGVDLVGSAGAEEFPARGQDGEVHRSRPAEYRYGLDWSGTWQCTLERGGADGQAVRGQELALSAAGYQSLRRRQLFRGSGGDRSRRRRRPLHQGPGGADEAQAGRLAPDRACPT